MSWTLPDWCRVALVVMVAVAALAVVFHISQPTSTTVDADAAAVASHHPPAAPAAAPPTNPPTVGNHFADRVPRFGTAPPPMPATPPAGAAAPLLHRVPTMQPVAFITIDDGVVRHPDALEVVRASGVPVSLFLVSSLAREDPAYFGRFQEVGATIQAHTVTHRILQGQPYGVQRQEICGSADELAVMYGRRPTLFRPPGGNYDRTTLRAAADCGMRAVLHWTQTVNGGQVQHQGPGHRIRPGDVILMHFRHTFVDDYLAALRAISESGLTPARLEDYLPA